MPLPCPADGPQAVLPSQRGWPLHRNTASRQIETAALAGAEPFTLMARAGQAVARLAVAVAPGTRRVWVASGPGNNGGDGLVAAHIIARPHREVEPALNSSFGLGSKD